jgi:UDP-N-acetylglucosamine 4,6-dehydratase/5-epimerase
MTIKGASILITGGTGSYGNAFVDRILREEPERIVIYSRDEQKQEAMARRLGAWGVDHNILRFFIGDVRDLDRLNLACHGIDTIVHAAALKIVPTAEYNPTECIATNVGGAQNVVKAAIAHRVQRVLALSTDKAVNPVNLYGASKLAAEKIFIASNALAAGKTAFSVMRYGNVVGSRGSAVPLFERLAKEGRPLTVTDERMTRFWITLPQAVDFSIVCLNEMIGREIFVPKIPSIGIKELALSYSNNITITGIRPGEKLHETLISVDEARYTIDLGNMFVISQEIEGRLPADFSYRSDTNWWWIHPEAATVTI